MANCGFCHRRFQSPQAVKAHLKHCKRYEASQSKKACALGTKLKAVITTLALPPVQSIPPIAAPDFAAPLREFEKALRESSTKQYAPQTPQQQRRTILQAAKAQVIDQYGTPLGQVTASLRGAAKLAIERELATLPLEELPFEEVLEIAVAIRDAGYVPAFTRQARKATRQRVEDERRHQKEVEALGGLIRADRRKKTLIQQASAQAHASCQEKAITGWAHLSVVGDIESRLEALLTGDEPILEAQAIVRSVLDVRFLEAEATLAAARANADARWHEDVEAVLVLGAVVGLVAFGLHYYPAQMVKIFEWIERTFTPGAEASAPNPEASKTTPPAASAEALPRSTRRRKDPAAPPGPESPWAPSVGPAHGQA